MILFLSFIGLLTWALTLAVAPTSRWLSHLKTTAILQGLLLAAGIWILLRTPDSEVALAMIVPIDVVSAILTLLSLHFVLLTWMDSRSARRD